MSRRDLMVEWLSSVVLDGSHRDVNPDDLEVAMDLLADGAMKSVVRDAGVDVGLLVAFLAGVSWQSFKSKRVGLESLLGGVDLPDF